MKKTKRARTAKSRQKAHAAGKPGRPTHNRLQHIAEDVMTQERRDRRARPPGRTHRAEGAKTGPHVARARQAKGSLRASSDA